MEWRIYYPDGSTHDDTQGPAVGDLARGVQVILQVDDDPAVGWSLVAGSDYYVYRAGRWWGVDISGLFDFLLDTGLVAIGRMLDRRQYDTIFSQAMADRELPDKTAFLPKRMGEHRPDGPT